MASLLDNQTVSNKLQALSAKGNPTTLPAGVPVWTSSDTSIVTLTSSVEGQTCAIVCTGKLGSVAGISTPPFAVTVVAGQAASLQMVVGIPTP